MEKFIVNGKDLVAISVRTGISLEGLIDSCHENDLKSAITSVPIAKDVYKIMRYPFNKLSSVVFEKWVGLCVDQVKIATTQEEFKEILENSPETENQIVENAIDYRRVRLQREEVNLATSIEELTSLLLKRPLDDYIISKLDKMCLEKIGTLSSLKECREMQKFVPDDSESEKALKLKIDGFYRPIVNKVSLPKDMMKLANEMPDDIESRQILETKIDKTMENAKILGDVEDFSPILTNPICMQRKSNSFRSKFDQLCLEAAKRARTNKKVLKLLKYDLGHEVRSLITQRVVELS